MNFTEPGIFADWSISFTPEVGGIYKLLGNSSGGQYPVLYVGQSNNIKRRLNEHFDALDTHFRGEIMHYCYSVEINQSVRDHAEKTLIEYYNPKFNKLLKSYESNNDLYEMIKSVAKNMVEKEKKDREQIDYLHRNLPL